MQARELKYSAGGRNCVGYLAFDESLAGPRPGILVFPEAFGLNDHARERADRLAAAGYVALAADLHGDGTVYPDIAAVGPAIRAFYGDRSAWRSMAVAAFNALVAQPLVDRRCVGAIGFCFGGTTCLELARTGADVRAVTTFHAGLNVGLPEDAGRIRAKVLVCHGAEDPVVQHDSIQAFMDEMRRDKVDWQFVYHGNAVHSFTEPTASKRGAPAFAYNRNAEARSWAAMQFLFDETFADS